MSAWRPTRWRSPGLDSRQYLRYDGVYYRDAPTPIPMAGYEPDGQTDLAIDFIRQSPDP